MGAVFDILVLYWAWRPWPLVSSEQRPKSENLGRRTLTAIVWPLAIAAAFSVASVFSSRIILSGHRGSDVLLRQLDYNSCGHLVYNTYRDGNQQFSLASALFQQMTSQDNLAARAYAESCYSSKNYSSPALLCSVYPTAQLPYTARLRKSSCPFGDQKLTFDFSPCNSSMNVGSYEMWTDMLDSNDHLGISAPPKDRIKLQRNVTCSTINAETYGGVGGLYTPEIQYKLGNTPVNGDLGNNITYISRVSASLVAQLISILVSYEPYPREDYRYQFSSTRAFQPNVFDPTPDFDITNSDRTLLFFEPMSRNYGEPYYKQKVLDPFYSATKKVSLGYQPTNPVSIMGCIDRYQMCNPIDRLQCTQATSLAGLRKAMRLLSFNTAQNVTAQRLYSVLENSNTYTNIYTDGQFPLQVPLTYIQIPYLGVFAPGVPSDQWELEMKLWFEYGLAKMQQKATEYVSSSTNLRQLAPESFPTKDPDLLKEFKRQCSTQRVKNNGDFTTISLFGVILVLVIGSLLSMIGFGFHRAIPLWRQTRFKKSRSKASLSREYTYSADSKYLLQYMAFANVLRQEPMKVVADIPVFRGNPRVPDPRPGLGGTYSYKYHSKTESTDEISETVDTVDDEPGSNSVS